MVIAWPINLNVSCELHPYSLQRTWSPPGSHLSKRIRNMHPWNRCPVFPYVVHKCLPDFLVMIIQFTSQSILHFKKITLYHILPMVEELGKYLKLYGKIKTTTKSQNTLFNVIYDSLLHLLLTPQTGNQNFILLVYIAVFCIILIIFFS